MGEFGDALPAPRKKGPWMPLLAKAYPWREVGFTCLSPHMFGTFTHYDKETKHWIRHTTGQEQCAWCLLSRLKPRWNGWVFVQCHADKRPYLFKITDTAVKYSPDWESTSNRQELLGTYWRTFRSTEKKNGPLCIRKGEEPTVRMPFIRLPDLVEVVLNLYHQEAGLPGMEEPPA